MFALTLAALPLIALSPSQDPRVVRQDAELIVRPDCADSIVDQGMPQNCIAASTTPTLGMLYPLSESFFVDPSGRVGIGTTNPVYALDVTSDSFSSTLRVTNTGGGAAIVGCGPGIGFAGFSGVGVWGCVAASGTTGVLGTAVGDALYGVRGTSSSSLSDVAGVFGRLENSTPGSFSAGVRGENQGTGSLGVGVYGSHGGNGYGVYGRAAGNSGYGLYGLGTNYGVYSFGDLGAAGAKSFVQPHPTDSTKEIRFVCLEGNESGTYFRGSSRLANGRVVIEVPEEFRLVSEEDGLTVQLTPVGLPVTLWIESRDLERIVVRGDVDCDFDYFVNGVRRGFADFQTIRPNTSLVPQVAGEPYAAELPEDVREILVGNGTLNPDYTPNETTALLNGWALTRSPR